MARVAALATGIGMKPTEGADRLGAAGTAEDTQRTPILAERDADRKQPPGLGNCIRCEQHSRLLGGATTCPTCAAWRRWHIAHRIAGRYLREATR